MAGATYKDEFDALAADANSAISNIVVDLQDVLPGIRSSSVKRVVASIGKSLGRIDRIGARYPEFLATDDGYLPARALELIRGMPAAARAGAQHFATDVLPELLRMDEGLARAVGLGSSAIKYVKSQQVAELQSLTAMFQETVDKARASSSRIRERERKSEAIISALEARVAASDAAASSIQKTKAFIERLASSDARGKDSLEKLARISRDKSAEIVSITQQAAANRDKGSQLLGELDASIERVKQAEGALAETQKKANEILKGATQAGLAGAYKTERDRLSKEQRNFAIAFYVLVTSVVAYAAFFIVPVFTRILNSPADVSERLGESTLLLLVRLAVIAPVFWALIFTSRRHSKLEILQMDYAAKTATALAYSGYKDEMSDDASLATKLKDGLLVRFLEHPERLLNKEAVKETIGLDANNGLTYRSSTAPVRASEEAEE